MLQQPRLSRELKTIAAMVIIYCCKHHDVQKGTLCEDCKEFIQYAERRLAKCPFKEQKPTCGKCTIHCYQKAMQAKAKEIMRYSGPRMLWTHPIMAFCHLLDGRKALPELKSCRRAKKTHQIK